MVKQSSSAIAIFGGTFDPIHFGHLRTALEVYENFPVQEVRFIPSGNPVHRAAPQAAAHHRLAMVTQAITPYSFFTVDAYECTRKEPSYTIATLRYLRQTYPKAPLLLLIGSDAFWHFFEWHQAEEFLSLCHLLIIARPGRSKLELEQHHQLGPYLAKAYCDDLTVLERHLAGRIFHFAPTALDISAQHIRNIIHARLNCHFLLPDGIIDYIDTNALYDTIVS